VAYFECGEDGVEDVTCEVAHYSGAEFSPASPANGMVYAVLIRAHRRDADPFFPVEVGGDRVLAFGSAAAGPGGALP